MKTIYVSVDVESDGPCPGLYSMHELGAVAILGENKKDWKTFHCYLKPISAVSSDEALKVCGLTREDILKYPNAKEGITHFYSWLENLKVQIPTTRIVMISDNPAFDWQFVNYYFYTYALENPFGWSARRIGDIYAGSQKNLKKPWKHLRDTPHTHNALDDAMGNAEAFVKITEGFNE